MAYAVVRSTYAGSAATWLVPLVWPSVAVLDAGYALGLWPNAD